MILELTSFLNSFVIMRRAWDVFRAHPYISNVLGYTALFASADLIQQNVLGGKNTKRSPSEEAAGIDWSQTARVATVGFCFHANFNYHWLRGLERMLPGGGVKAVTGKVVVDQLIAAPLTISAFYIGRCDKDVLFYHLLSLFLQTIRTCDCQNDFAAGLYCMCFVVKVKSHHQKFWDLHICVFNDFFL